VRFDTIKDMKKALIILGPPGSGKGTQANLVAQKYNVFHLDTGRFLENLVHDSSLQTDPEVMRERDNFDSGKLLTPSFFIKWFFKKVEDVALRGEGIVFSGSPRTQEEAFGAASDDSGLIALLERLYGKDGVVVFLLEVPKEVSIERNSKRIICSVCGGGILGVLNLNLSQCPFCGGSLRTRTLDTHDVIKVRLEEYRKRTMPIIEGLTKRGFVINHIDATPMPFEVFDSISSIIDDTQKK